MRRVFAVIGALLAAQAAAAAPILVRSGEHADFSRLVLPLPDDAGWRLSPTADGYALVVDGLAGSALNLSQIFRFVPRTRLRDAVPGTGPVTLNLLTDRNSHAEAFVTTGGQLVIDIRDGAPPPGLQSGAPADAPTSEAIVASAEAMTGPLPLGPATATIPADPNTPLYWRDAPRVDAPMSDMKPPVAPIARDAGSRSDTPDLEPAAPLPSAGDLEPALRHQLARAAAQGLVEFDARSNVPASEPNGDPAEMPRQLDAATSIDRVLADPGAGIATGTDGGACPAPADYDIRDWGPDADFADGLAARRAGLVGEFDRADPARVLALARFYVHSGFGVEAAQALNAFAAQGPEAARIRTLARIVDGELPGAPELRGLTLCQSPVALWAVLSRPTLAPGDVVASGAVYEAFSGLPPHLRQSLGPPLAERFIAAGDVAMARSIRDAMERGSPDADAAIRLTDARLANAEGRRDDSEALLDAALHHGGPEAEEAALLRAEARVRDADAGTPEFRATVAALAFERRRTGAGVRFHRAHVLLLGLAGDWGDAFEALGDAAATDRPALTRELFGILAAHADDASLLERYFAGRDVFDAAKPTPDLRAALAARLEKAGFPDDAAALRVADAVSGPRRGGPDAEPAMPDSLPQRAGSRQAGARDALSAAGHADDHAADGAGNAVDAVVPAPHAEDAFDRTGLNKAEAARGAAALLADVARSRADWQARLAAPAAPEAAESASGPSAEGR